MLKFVGGFAQMILLRTLIKQTSCYVLQEKHLQRPNKENDVFRWGEIRKITHALQVFINLT